MFVELMQQPSKTPRLAKREAPNATPMADATLRIRRPAKKYFKQSFSTPPRSRRRARKEETILVSFNFTTGVALFSRASLGEAGAAFSKNARMCASGDPNKPWMAAPVTA